MPDTDRITDVFREVFRGPLERLMAIDQVVGDAFAPITEILESAQTAMRDAFLGGRR